MSINLVRLELLREFLGHEALVENPQDFADFPWDEALVEYARRLRHAFSVTRRSYQPAPVLPVVDMARLVVSHTTSTGNSRFVLVGTEPEDVEYDDLMHTNGWGGHPVWNARYLDTPTGLRHLYTAGGTVGWVADRIARCHLLGMFGGGQLDYKQIMRRYLHPDRLNERPDSSEFADALRLAHSWIAQKISDEKLAAAGLGRMEVAA